DHPHAQYSLAVMNAFGQGMEKDYAEALKWFGKSAEHGVAQAQYNLGVFYENGYGLTKNLDTAKQWYAKAAKQGLEEARQKLAELSKQPRHPEPQTLPQAAQTVAAEEPAPVNALPSPDPDTPAAASAGEIKREDWVSQQRPDSYTLQLSSV